jgi:hypothetical protein
MRVLSGEWRELAYTVLHSGATTQFYTGYETFGPRWTSLMDPVRVPVLAVRTLGAGEIALAQMGQWNLSASPNMDAIKQQTANSPLGVFAGNLVRWASRDAHVGSENAGTGSNAAIVH